MQCFSEISNANTFHWLVEHFSAYIMFTKSCQQTQYLSKQGQIFVRFYEEMKNYYKIIRLMRFN